MSHTNIDQLEVAEARKDFISLGEKEVRYQDAEWTYITDRNTGATYTGAEIKFDTTERMADWIVYRESYIVIPLRITSSGTAYTAASKFAFKNSVLSMFRSLAIEPSTGDAIVNDIDGALPLVNNLRLLTESDIDWRECSGQELHYFGVDRSVNSNVMTGTGTPMLHAGPASSVGIVVPSNDVVNNRSLSDRVSVFSTQADASTASQRDIIISVPLKFIHNWFDQMGFPLINYPFRMRFGLSSVGSGNGAFMPITCVRSALVGTINAVGDAVAAQAPIAAGALPTISINRDVSVAGFTPGNCRIYLKTVKFRGSDAEAMMKQVDSGFKKVITYKVANYYKTESVAVAANAAKAFTQEFGQSTKRPERVWALFPPHDVEVTSANTFPATVGTAYIKNCNLKINNQELRKNGNYESQYELYQALREAQLGSGYGSTQGGSVSYHDFLVGGARYYLFDLSRHPTALQNLPITFTFHGDIVITGGAAANLDAIFLVERLRTCTIDVNKSRSLTTVVDGTV